MHNVCINENTDIEHANEIHVSFVGCRLVVDSPLHPLLREVFLWVLRFSHLLKTQHFQIPIRPEIR